MAKNEFEQLKEDVHYLVVAHCKYKDINYGQLEEMSYDERFTFLLGFETSLKAIENAMNLHGEIKKHTEIIEWITMEMGSNVFKN